MTLLPGQIARPFRAAVWLLALAALGACAEQAAESRGPGGQLASPAAQPAAAQPARGAKHMVAAANPLAARAGLEILRAGGSAVDAMIATQMVLTLVEPQSSGIGGGAFLLHSSAKTGAIEAFDGRETAPAAATPDMFLRGGEKIPFPEARAGGLGVGVPGVVGLLEAAHKKHGKLPWAKLFDPAIALAENGFALSPRLHAALAGAADLKDFPAAAKYFLGPGGAPKPVGTLLVNKPLAATFRAIAAGGAAAFYRGKIAEAIVRAVRTHRRNPGRMVLSDLAKFKAKARGPVCLPYRKWLVCGMPPPTSGGVGTLETLGILEQFDLSALAPGSAAAVHLITEASRIAFADRNLYLADPDFVRVPVTRILDPGYLAKRAAEISPGKSLGKAKPGIFAGRAANRAAPDDGGQGVSTTHISIVDRDGNAAVMTSSVEGAFGSRLMVGGFLLNHQLTDFSFLPARNGWAIANRVEAGKRPRSSMDPILVFDGAGKLVLAVGSPGGSRIIGYVTKTIIAVLDWGMNVQAAISLPHFVNRNGATDLEKGTAAEKLKPALEALGHEVRVRPLNSGLHAIKITAGKLTGGADPRREGIAIGD